MESQDLAAQTQAEFPHLLVLADADRGLSEAASLIHAGAAPTGNDADIPTTVLLDRGRTVRWLFRPRAAITRLSPDDTLTAIDTHLPSH
jgi:hypothetical protein